MKDNTAEKADRRQVMRRQGRGGLAGFLHARALFWGDIQTARTMPFPRSFPGYYQALLVVALLIWLMLAGMHVRPGATVDSGTDTFSIKKCFVEFRCPAADGALMSAEATATKSTGENIDGSVTQRCRQTMCIKDRTAPLTILLDGSVLDLRGWNETVAFPLAIRMKGTPEATKGAKLFIGSNHFTDLTVNVTQGLIHGSGFTADSAAISLGHGPFIYEGPLSAPLSLTGTMYDNNFCVSPTLSAFAVGNCSIVNTTVGNYNISRSLCPFTASVTTGTGSTSYINVHASSIYINRVESNGTVVPESRVAGAGMAAPPEMDPEVLRVLANSSNWAAKQSAPFQMQVIDTITPGLGMTFVHSSSALVSRLGLPRIAYFTSFVMIPYYRRIATSLSHYRCPTERRSYLFGSQTQVNALLPKKGKDWSETQYKQGLEEFIDPDLQFELSEVIRITVNQANALVTVSTPHTDWELRQLGHGFYGYQSHGITRDAFGLVTTALLEWTWVEFILLSTMYGAALVLIFGFYAVLVIFREAVLRSLLLISRRSAQRHHLSGEAGVCPYHYFISLSMFSAWAAFRVSRYFSLRANISLFLKYYFVSFDPTDPDQDVDAAMCRGISDQQLIGMFSRWMLLRYENVNATSTEEINAALDAYGAQRSVQDKHVVLGLRKRNRVSPSASFGLDMTMLQNFYEVTNDRSDSVLLEDIYVRGVVEFPRLRKEDLLAYLQERSFTIVKRPVNVVSGIRPRLVSPEGLLTEDYTSRRIAEAEQACASWPSWSYILYDTEWPKCTWWQQVQKQVTFYARRVAEALFGILLVGMPIMVYAILNVMMDIQYGHVSVTNRQYGVIDIQKPLSLYLLEAENAVTVTCVVVFLVLAISYVCEILLVLVTFRSVGRYGYSSWWRSILVNLRFLLGALGFLFFMVSIGGNILYCASVLVWWILGAIIAPNFMLVYASAAFAFVYTVYSTYSNLATLRSGVVRHLEHRVLEEILKLIRKTPAHEALASLRNRLGMSNTSSSTVNAGMLIDASSDDPEVSARGVEQIAKALDVPEALVLSFLAVVQQTPTATHRAVAALFDTLRVPEVLHPLATQSVNAAVGVPVNAAELADALVKLMPGEVRPAAEILNDELTEFIAYAVSQKGRLDPDSVRHCVLNVAAASLTKVGLPREVLRFLTAGALAVYDGRTSDALVTAADLLDVLRPPAPIGADFGGLDDDDEGSARPQMAQSTALFPTAVPHVADAINSIPLVGGVTSTPLGLIRDMPKELTALVRPLMQCAAEAARMGAGREHRLKQAAVSLVRASPRLLESLPLYKAVQPLVEATALSDDIHDPLLTAASLAVSIIERRTSATAEQWNVAQLLLGLAGGSGKFSGLPNDMRSSDGHYSAAREIYQKHRTNICEPSPKSTRRGSTGRRQMQFAVRVGEMITQRLTSDNATVSNIFGSGASTYSGSQQQERSAPITAALAQEMLQKWIAQQWLAMLSVATCRPAILRVPGIDYALLERALSVPAKLLYLLEDCAALFTLILHTVVPEEAHALHKAVCEQLMSKRSLSGAFACAHPGADDVLEAAMEAASFIADAFGLDELAMAVSAAGESYSAIEALDQFIMALSDTVRSAALGDNSSKIESVEQQEARRRLGLLRGVTVAMEAGEQPPTTDGPQRPGTAVDNSANRHRRRSMAGGLKPAGAGGAAGGDTITRDTSSVLGRLRDVFALHVAASGTAEVYTDDLLGAVEKLSVVLQRKNSLTSTSLLELQPKEASGNVPRLGAQKAYLSTTELNDAVNVLIQGYLNRQLAARDVVPLATAFSIESMAVEVLLDPRKGTEWVTAPGLWHVLSLAGLGDVPEPSAVAALINGDTTGQMTALIRGMGIGDAADVVAQLASQLPRLAAPVARARAACALTTPLRPLLLKGFKASDGNAGVAIGAPHLEAMVEAVIHFHDLEAAIVRLQEMLRTEADAVVEGRVAAPGVLPVQETAESDREEEDGADGAAEDGGRHAHSPDPDDDDEDEETTSETFTVAFLAALDAQCPNLCRVIGTSRTKASHVARVLGLQLTGAKAAVIAAMGDEAHWPGLPRGVTVTTAHGDSVELPLTPLAALLCDGTHERQRMRCRAINIAWGVVPEYPRALPRAFYALTTLMALGSATPARVLSVIASAFPVQHRELARELLSLQCGDKTAPLLAVANAVEAPVEALLRLRECLFPSIAKDPSLALLCAAVRGDACTPLGLDKSWADRDIAAVALTQTTALSAASAVCNFIKGHAPTWGFRSEFAQPVALPTNDAQAHGGDPSVSTGVSGGRGGGGGGGTSFGHAHTAMQAVVDVHRNGTFVKFISILDRALSADIVGSRPEGVMAKHTTAMAVLLLAGDFAGARGRAKAFCDRPDHPVKDEAKRGGMYFGELLVVMLTRLVVEQDTVRDTADVLRLLAAACDSFPAIVAGAGPKLSTDETVIEVMSITASAAAVGGDLLRVLAADVDATPLTPTEAKALAESRRKLTDPKTMGELMGNLLRLISGAVSGDAQEGLEVVENIARAFAMAATAPPQETPGHVLTIVESVLPLLGQEKEEQCRDPLATARVFVSTVAPVLYSQRDATGAQILIKTTQALVQASASSGVLSAREHRKLTAIVGLASGDLRVLPEILQIAGINIAPDHLERLQHTFRALTTMTDVVSRNADATPNASDVLEIITSQVFHELDTDRSGEITFQEFQLALVRLHIDVSEAEAAVWFSELDVTGRGVLTRDDFLQTVKAIRHRFLSEIVERLGLSRELIYIWLAWLSVFLGLVLGFVVLGAYGFSNGTIFTAVITAIMPALAGVVALLQDTSQVQRVLSQADDILDEFFQALSNKHRGV